jgi:hypothetical protein
MAVHPVPDVLERERPRRASAHSKEQVPRPALPAERLLQLQRSAGNQAVARLLQPRRRLSRQKTPGRYQLTKEARLRDDAPPAYPVRHTIPKGAHVQVQDKGTRTSNFKAGRKTNEHSWTAWQAQTGATSGWIEDSKLKATPEPQQPSAHASPPPLSIPATPASTVIPRPSVPAHSTPKPTVPPTRRPQTAAIGIGGGKRQAADDKSMGSRSFQEELTAQSPGDLNPLLGNVRVTDVKPVDQTKLKVTISGDRLYTHDGKHLLDSDEADIRYVLCQIGNGGLQLYASQMFRHKIKADTSDTPVDMIGTYPFMESHAQVTGTVIGAGDFVVSNGQITEISNKSGTWHPRGSHLAAALRAMTAWRVLDTGLVKTGAIPVKQFLPGSDAENVDEGDLVTLNPRHLQTL